ncbi:hypothetical protein D3C74_383560 [compost metagenome]
MVANAIGARKLAARPVVAYRPNASASRPSSLIRPSRARLADWAGPTNAHSSRPQTQKTFAPPSCWTKTAVPEITRPTSEPRITRRGPILSSSQPAAIVESPATTFAAIANTMTSLALNPNVPEAITAPNVKTPARPSR